MATASSDLVISNFKVGIGPSPHMGFGDQRNLDTTTRPGIARINNSAVKKSGTAVTNLPRHIIRDPAGDDEYFALDNNGEVYSSLNGGTTWSLVTGHGATGGTNNGQGLVIWQDYLFVARNSRLDLYGPLAGSPTWTNDWQIIESDTRDHPMLVSVNDGNLYGGADNFIFSVTLDHPTGTFSPTGATSFVWDSEALDLDDTYRIRCLAELGDNLMIGTIYSFNNADAEYSNRPDGVLFPWDRESPQYGTPMVMQEKGINQMITVNNVLYIQASFEGKYFKSNGVQYQQIAQLPNYLVNLDGDKFLDVHPDAMKQYKGRIFFGVSPGNGATDIGGMGVWSIDPVTNALAFEHSISTESMGTNSVVTIGSILPTTGQTLLIGWSDGATAGIDKTGTARYENYQGYLDSPFYQVGTPLIKKEFSQLEFQLVEPLATGQGVKISYRTDLSAAYTLIGTYDFTLLGAVASHNAIANIPACEFVQLRVALTTAAATNASPQLRTVTLR